MSTIRPRGTNGSQHTASTFSKTTHDKELTHERIAADMAAFSKAGGRVEVLGVTPLRRKPEGTAPTSNDASAKKRAPDRSKG